ncbi:TPA: hypothetical protein DCL30_04740 [Candidatus Peribacteria bacterium]|nr:MAG: hypothetical protein A2529_04800 [Candidatus Peribacteria bacterium RIFOXYD2_FULL_58_15]HAI98810.1 hypothetical protein [Candidatus Peribacteria bacterium]HAS34068.1 hypothetical protein [Candidatus Peribacteria bacterium]
MKKFQPVSFGIGVLSGALVLVLVIGGLRFFGPARPFPRTGMNGGTLQQRQGDGQGMNFSRMAQRLHMTEDELRAALGSGKTIRDISAERGIAFPDRGWGRDSETGSGAFPPAKSDQSSSHSSASSLPAQP